ncbi:hypothetical protein CEXT_500551 [Caerostris extrusa]|uniref:Uncharacterized protein n=1 Tax=Caerostris extrusa TaxID=172846 RepID=A0AAV4UJH5_CAEEX|nr:hypothetical protein CEXT_500551 [Caerostris extrusa]
MLNRSGNSSAIHNSCRTRIILVHNRGLTCCLKRKENEIGLFVLLTTAGEITVGSRSPITEFETVPRCYYIVYNQVYHFCKEKKNIFQCKLQEEDGEYTRVILNERLTHCRLPTGFLEVSLVENSLAMLFGVLAAGSVASSPALFPTDKAMIASVLPRH